MLAKRYLPVLVAMTLLPGLLALTPATAAAAPVQTAWWGITSTSAPTNIPPGGEATIVVDVTDLGDAAVSSETAPVAISDVLPEGLTATGIKGAAGEYKPFPESPDGEVTCHLAPVPGCMWSSSGLPLQSYEQIELEIRVRAETAAGTPSNDVTVSGGEAVRCEAAREGRYNNRFCTSAKGGESTEYTGQYERRTGAPVGAASSTMPLTVSDTSTPFGVAAFGAKVESDEGGVVRQVGSHPFQFTTNLVFNGLEDSYNAEGASIDTVAAPLKSVKLELPAGLVGNATVLAKCSEADFSRIGKENSDYCPDSTVVGAAEATVALRIGAGVQGGLVPSSRVPYLVPVFNLVPAPGEPARFGFLVERAPVIIDTSVRTGSDYGITATVSNLSESQAILSTLVTLWGTPGDSRHDSTRGWNCLGQGAEGGAEGLPSCESTHNTQPAPFLRMPTSCQGELEIAAEAGSWTGQTSTPKPSAIPGIEGCGQVPFAAEALTMPDQTAASAPIGPTITVEASQEASSDAEGIADSDVRDVTLTLPEGVTINPAAASGLEACGEPAIGFERTEGALERFTPTIGSPFCPEASKIGTVTIHTPLLENPLQGAVYVAAQSANPFGSLLAMYLVAEDPASGVLVKLAGEVSLNPATGQITTSFKETPQVPFDELEVKLFGGPRAALSAPVLCRRPGEPGYQTVATFTPWSGGTPVTSTSEFSILSGPNGSACPNPAGNQSPNTRPFHPTFTAGTTATQAGAYSPFTLTFARKDGEQNLNSIEQTLPPGLLAKLAGVPLCGEAQANEGSCPVGSQIGTVTVAAGVGSEPLYVNGTIYLTGPYNNGPFGIAVEVPAIAGPFNLDENGRPVVVRGSIRINPTTAQATVVSNAFPTILQGIPLQVRTVNVTLNRPGFTFNPTDCVAQKVTGAISSTEGANVGVSSPFGAVNCATLPFKPTLTATTQGNASKAYGASLVVKIASKGGPGTGGEEANIRSVKVDLPVKLPSRLSTLQKACTEAKFNANPASCPKESDVGTATASTPILANPLTGPAYLVSHGGEAFPALEIVLQGEGVTLVLDGNTLIKKGVTSSTFRTVPDAPISSFELKLPTKKFSILTTDLPQSAHYNLCGQTLNMPTAITGQNGVEIHDTTTIAVSGCAAKAKTLTRGQKLTKALKACRKKAKDRRASCEATARKDYGPIKGKR